MSSAVSYPINVKSFCSPTKTGWLKWSIKHTWMLCSNKKQLLNISRMKVISNPIQKHCFNLWLMESHGAKTPQRSKTSEKLRSSGHWSEINSLLTASLGWGSFHLNWKPAAQVYFNPTIHDFLSWDMKRHKCSRHTHMSEWHLCPFNDYQRCPCWLVWMAAHTAVIQS